MANKNHLKMLLGGVEGWNDWRKRNPQTRPLLAGAELEGADLKAANLSGADLSGANLGSTYLNDANLENASLSRANLRSAYAHKANLAGADLSETNLLSADLHQTTVTNANLMRAHLVDTNFEGATIADCFIYGISAWNVSLTGAKQSNLTISPPQDPAITVDDIKMAQFIYLLLNNAEIRDVIDTITSKAVLILGRFTPSRKMVLDKIKAKLQELNFVPIIFDFARPASRNITETVRVLAGMSLFVVADLTHPKSIPLELQAIVPDYAIPFVPILHEDDEPFAMLRDLQQLHDWILPELKYDTPENLITYFRSAVVDRALKKHDELLANKMGKMNSLHISQFMGPRTSQDLQKDVSEGSAPQ